MSFFGKRILGSFIALSLFIFFFRNITQSHAGPPITKPVIQISGLAAAPNPFSPLLNYVKITGSITISPSVTRNIPWTGKITNSKTTQTLYFTSGSGTSISFRWNGKDQTGATASDGTYIVTVTASAIGATSDTESITIQVDQTAPQITINSPEDGSWTNQSQVTLEGSVDDLEATVLVNQAQVELLELGVFSQELTVSEGANTISIQAEDAYGNSSSQELTVYLDTEAPTLNLDPSGGTLYTNQPTLTVSYSDTGSGLDLESLVINLDGENITSLFTVTPNSSLLTLNSLSEGEHSWSALIQDQAGNEISSGATFTVQTVDPPTPSDDSGYIDGQVLDADTEEPIQGAFVTVDTIEGTIVTDSEGKFGFPIPKSIYYNVRIAKESYIESGRRIEALATRDVGLGKIYLKKEDTKKTEITSDGGTATDSQNLIEMNIPAGALTEEEVIQAGATWFDEGKELPGPLPESSQFTYAMELLPDGATFDSPVTVKFKNTRGFPAGTNLPAGYWDKEKLQWIHETTATVSSDGQWIEYEVTHFSPRDINVPVAIQNPPSDVQIEALQTGKFCPVDKNFMFKADIGNSSVEYLNGHLRETINLAGYQVLSEENTLKFLYNSETINPYFRARITKHIMESNTAIPNLIRMNINFEGKEHELQFDGTLDPFQENLLLKKENARGQILPTGHYTWEARVSYLYTNQNFWTTSIFGGPPETSTSVSISSGEYANYSTQMGENQLIINEKDSVVGSGWSIEGYERLYENPATNSYAIIGEGGYELFQTQYQVISSYLANEAKMVESINNSVQGTYSVNAAKHLSVTPDGRKLYISSDNQPIVQVVDLKTGKATTQINIGSELAITEIFASPNSKRLYVGCYWTKGQAKYIKVINTETDKITNTLEPYTFPKYFAETPNGTKLFVSESNGPYSAIQIFDTSTLALIKTLWPDNYGSGLAAGYPIQVTPDGTKAYALCTKSTYTSAYLFVIDAITNQAIKMLSVGSYIPTGLVITPDSGRAITTYEKHPTYNPTGDIYITNAAQDMVMGQISIGNPNGIALTQDGKRAYISDQYKLAVLVMDVEKLSIIKEIAVPATGPITITPDQRKVYCLGLFGGEKTVKLSIIDTTTNALTQTTTLANVAGSPGEIITSPKESVRHMGSDESIVVKELDGTYTRTYKDQSKDYFSAIEGDTGGYKTKSCDTHGNCSQYIWKNQSTVDSPQTTDKKLETIIDPIGQETTFSYTAEGKLQSITDPQGRTTQLTIDDKGDLVQITHPDNSTYQFKYDEEHRLIEKTTPRGYTTKYIYDKYGFIEKVEAPTGEIREYSPGILDKIIDPETAEGQILDLTPYESKGSYTEKKDALGNIWKRWINGYGRVTEEEDPLGRATKYEYDGRGNLIKTIFPNDAIEERTYDVNGNMLTKSVIAPQSASGGSGSEGSIITGYTYDSTFNKPTTITDALGNLTKLEYDATTGGLTKIIDAYNDEWIMTYTSQGLLETITDPEGHITQYFYDDQGNLDYKIDALGYTWDYTRDAAGNLTAITDSLGHSTAYSYDELNRLTGITDAEEGLTQISYEDSGCAECGSSSDLVTALTDANGHTWEFKYDEIGQLTAVIDPLGNTTGRTYDLNRNLKSIIDAEIHITEYFYDPANQLTQTLNADGGTIDYTYTLLGKVETLTDPNKNITNFGYDGIGRLTSETDPLGYTTGYNYDKNHNLIEKSTPNGHTITYGYDKLNRLTQKVAPEQTYAFTYDSLSRLTGASNAASSLSFAYDALGQLIQSQVSSPLSLVLDYGYDSAGRKTSLTDPTGSTSYGFDKANRLTSIDVIASEQSESGNLSFNITYDKAGRRLSLSGPAGIERAYDYDNANRLLSLINKVNGVEVAPFQYEYDKVGNRTGIVDKWGNHLTEYDDVYRLLSLTNALATGTTETFSYDVTGNRLSDVTQSYEPNKLNQATSGSNGLSLSYDNNGNLISKIKDGITWTYSWSSDDKLLSASSSDGKTVSYQYNALGRRISKSSNGITTQWVHDGEDILLEYKDGSLVERYTHGPWIDEPLARTDLTTSQNYYYHPDALGSISAITDSTGSVVEVYRYSSYGVPAIYDQDGLEIDESVIGNRYLFAGREYDFETGIYYHRERYRFADTGTWASKDPQGFDDGPNLYTYVGNNPINYIDPWGLDKTEWILIEDGRTLWEDGPRNGNWGGGKWSGGKGGGKIGTAPYTDSGDLLYMQHDFSWARCEKKYGCDSEKLQECKRQYNKELVDKARKLPRDPRDWPEPPRPGTEMDSSNFRDLAIDYFEKRS